METVGTIVAIGAGGVAILGAVATSLGWLYRRLKGSGEGRDSRQDDDESGGGGGTGASEYGTGIGVARDNAGAKAEKGFVDHQIDFEDALAQLGDDTQWLSGRIRQLSNDMRDAAPRIVHARSKGARPFRQELSRMAQRADRYSEAIESRLPGIERNAHELRDAVVGWVEKSPGGSEFREYISGFITDHTTALLVASLEAKGSVTEFRKSIGSLRSLNATADFNAAMDRLDDNVGGQVEFLNISTAGYRKMLSTINRRFESGG